MKKYIDALKKYAEEKNREDSKAYYKYENPRTGEILMYSRRGPHKKDGVSLVYKGKADNDNQQ